LSQAQKWMLYKYDSENKKLCVDLSSSRTRCSFLSLSRSWRPLHASMRSWAELSRERHVHKVYDSWRPSATKRSFGSRCREHLRTNFMSRILGSRPARASLDLVVEKKTPSSTHGCVFRANVTHRLAYAFQKRSSAFNSRSKR